MKKKILCLILALTMCMPMVAATAFAANSYTITFDKNGGAGGNDSITVDDNGALPELEMPVRPGYYCTGYYDSKGDGNQYYNGQGKSTSSWDKKEDATLYAHWMGKPYPVQYCSQDDAIGDIVCVGQDTAFYGEFEVISAAELNLAREGYEFVGWNAYPDQDWAMYEAGKTYLGGLSTEENETAILYAAWKKPETAVENAQPPVTVDEIVIHKTYGDEPFTQVAAGGVDGAIITYSIPNESERQIASIDETTGEITILQPGIAVIEARAHKDGYIDTPAYFVVIIDEGEQDQSLTASIFSGGNGVIIVGVAAAVVVAAVSVIMIRKKKTSD